MLTFNEQDVEVLTLRLRYCAPEGGLTDNVPLPTIEAFGVRTGQTVNLPTPYLLRGGMPKWVM